jgi:Ser/Thr protein kinase RdoA (MazF antagonist)
MIRLSNPIAIGRTAEVYEWQDGQVLKLFYDWVPKAQVDFEARIARVVHETGLPVPAVGDAIEMDGRQGLLYERVAGSTMLEQLRSRPWRVTDYARQLARLQSDMHAHSPVAALPKQHGRLRERIEQVAALPEGIRAALLRSLSELPAGEQLCHGDFHPGNVMLTAREPVIIDWIDVTLGNPLADVARTSILLLGEAHNMATSAVARALIRLFHRVYLNEYVRMSSIRETEYRAWLPIVAAARLSEGISEQEEWLLGQAELVLAGA